MDREVLRQKVLNGYDRLANLSRLLISSEERQIIYALRLYWQRASGGELDLLLTYLPTTMPAEETDP